MKHLLPVRMLLPIGLLVTATGLMLNQLLHLPDSVYGFLLGAGIGIMLFGVYKQKRMKQGS